MFGKKKEMSEAEKKAKLSALKEAHGMASDAMKKGLDGVKKVSVMAPSKEGLKKGLDLAEKMVGEQEDEDSELGEKMEDAQAGYEDQQESSEPMDEDEIDAEIQRLMELKAKLSQE
jgi:hypothetical protein